MTIFCTDCGETHYCLKCREYQEHTNKFCWNCGTKISQNPIISLQYRIKEVEDTLEHFRRGGPTNSTHGGLPDDAWNKMVDSLLNTLVKYKELLASLKGEQDNFCFGKEDRKTYMLSEQSLNKNPKEIFKERYKEALGGVTQLEKEQEESKKGELTDEDIENAWAGL